METYRTRQGDMWDSIAYSLYPGVGREMCMSKLLEANEAHRETVIFSAGTELAVPEIGIPAVENLPPWKKHRASGGDSGVVCRRVKADPNTACI